MIELNWQQDNYGFYSQETSVVSGSTSDAIKMEFNVTPTIYLFPSGRAYIEYTGDLIDVVEAGNAEWVKWPIGNSRRAVSDTLLGTATAIRLVSINGAATVKVVAK